MGEYLKPEEEYRSIEPEPGSTKEEKEAKVRWLEAQSEILTETQRKELARLKEELNPGKEE